MAPYFGSSPFAVMKITNAAARKKKITDVCGIGLDHTTQHVRVLLPKPEPYHQNEKGPKDAGD